MLKRAFQRFLLAIFKRLLSGYFLGIEKETWEAGFQHGYRTGRAIKENIVGGRAVIVAGRPPDIVKKQIEEILKKNGDLYD